MSDCTKNLNVLIPKLIEKNTEYCNEYKNRISARNILISLDSKASLEFHKFISNSNTTYKSSKCGNRIGNTINNSLTKMSTISKNILNNNYYTTLNLEKEKLKLNQPFIDNNFKEIGNILKQIKQNSNSLTDYEKNYRDYLNEKLKKRQKKLSYNNIKNHKKLKQNNEKLKNDNKIIISYIQDDQNNFDKQMKCYSKSLKKIRNLTEATSPSPSNNNIFNSNKYLIKRNLKFTLNDKYFKMLNYTKHSKNINQKNNLKDYLLSPINLDKLQKIIKKRTYTLNNQEDDDDYILQYNSNNNIFKDTKNIVTDCAKTSLNYNQIMNNKMNRFNDKINLYKLPCLNEYEDLIKEKFNEKKKINQIFKRNRINNEYENQKISWDNYKKHLEDRLKNWKITDINVEDYFN